MEKEYILAINEKNPLIHLRLPDEILKDLVVVSNNNGTGIELEIAMRLARTLERDHEMEMEDDNFASLAFENCTRENNNK